MVITESSMIERQVQTVSGGRRTLHRKRFRMTTIYDFSGETVAGGKAGFLSRIFAVRCCWWVKYRQAKCGFTRITGGLETLLEIQAKRP